MEQHKQPILKAVLLAPIAAPLVVSAAMVWGAVEVSGIGALRDTAMPALFFFVFLFGIPISYAAMLVLGLPYVLWLRSRNRLTWGNVCISAALFSSATWTCYWQLSLRPPALPTTVAIGAMIGLLVGVVFSWAAGLIFHSKGAS